MERILILAAAVLVATAGYLAPATGQTAAGGTVTQDPPQSGSTAGIARARAARRKEATRIRMDETAKQVADLLKAFRSTKNLENLRHAQQAIEAIEVYQLPDVAARQAARKTKLVLWLDVLDSIDAETDPGFDPADVPAARITPPDLPLGSDAPFASPEAIRDPAERRKYDEKVKANAEKTRRYVFQKELAQWNKRLTERAEAYLKSAYLKSPADTKEAGEAIREHIHGPQRASRLKELVKR